MIWRPPGIDISHLARGASSRSLDGKLLPIFPQLASQRRASDILSSHPCQCHRGTTETSPALAATISMQLARELLRLNKRSKAHVLLYLLPTLYGSLVPLCHIPPPPSCLCFVGLHLASTYPPPASLGSNPPFPPNLYFIYLDLTTGRREYIRTYIYTVLSGP